MCALNARNIRELRNVKYVLYGKTLEFFMQQKEDFFDSQIYYWKMEGELLDEKRRSWEEENYCL